MSIEDVERIMDETREGIEYQRVGAVDIKWKNVLFSHQPVLILQHDCKLQYGCNSLFIP